MRNVQQIKVIKFVKMLVITALLTLPVLMRAQGPVDPPPSDPPPVDGDPGAPIDGGLTDYPQHNRGGGDLMTGEIL